jgi:hypothetical protein
LRLLRKNAWLPWPGFIGGTARRPFLDRAVLARKSASLPRL